MPRDIEPEVNFMEDIYLYNIDDLQAIADSYLHLRKEEIAKCESIVNGKAKELLESQSYSPRDRQDSTTPTAGTEPIVN